MSLAKTYLQDIRADYPSALDRDELRMTQTGLINAVLRMTDSPNSIVSPDLKNKAKTSQARNLDVPVMKKGNITINNVRSCTIGGGQSESDLVRVTWKTVSADILMVPSQYEKNDVGYLYDFNKKIKETVEALLVEMENDIDTALDTNKSQVYGSPIVSTKYTPVGNALQVLPTDVEFFFADLNAVNFADDFNDPTMYIVADHSIMPYAERYINQGSSNNTNTAYQFAGKNFTFSNRVTNGAGKLGTGYFMPDGSVGFLTRVDADARMNHKAGDGTEWMEETLPGLPFTVGIQFKSKCDDKSALETAGLEHLTATMVQHWQISFDYAILTPYNSDIAIKPNAIRKFEFIPAP